MKVTVSERWALEVQGEGGYITIESHGDQAPRVTITCRVPSSGFGMSEMPGSTTSVTISSFDWAELVRVVDKRIKHEDGQR